MLKGFVRNFLEGFAIGIDALRVSFGGSKIDKSSPIARANGDCGNPHPTQEQADACARSIGRAYDAECEARHGADADAMEAERIAAALSPPVDLDLRPGRCVIIPHAEPKPGPLALDLHSAVLAVLQRPAHAAACDLRDPMDVVTVRRDGLAGPTYATVIRWYAPGERPIVELTAAEEEPPPPLDAAAVPRMDACVSYVKDPPRAVEPPTS